MHLPPRYITCALALFASALAACDDDAGVLGPDMPTPEFAQAAAPDVSGEWSWNEHGRYILSEAAAALFGVAPEGPRTILDCESGGTLTIVQSGTTFAGTATQTSSCETSGGQVAASPPFPPELDIIDGTIQGRRISFTFGAGPIPCPYTATVAVEGGQALAMDGTGRCIPPGHPLSVLPVPPPPLAPGKTIDWNAWR
jgi:hypothetical protein